MCSLWGGDVFGHRMVREKTLMQSISNQDWIFTNLMTCFSKQKTAVVGLRQRFESVSLVNWFKFDI